MKRKRIELGTGDVTIEEVRVTGIKFKNKYPPKDNSKVSNA